MHVRKHAGPRHTHKPTLNISSDSSGLFSGTMWPAPFTVAYVKLCAYDTKKPATFKAARSGPRVIVIASGVCRESLAMQFLHLLHAEARF